MRESRQNRFCARIGSHSGLMQSKRPAHLYEVRPRKDGVDLISDALPFGRLWLSIQFLLMLNFTFTVKSMADVANKYAENVAGAFYVDDQCIDCDLCRETAPASFKRNDDGGHTYVYKQPETPEEEALCKEAMEGCPVEAIGNDGAIILAPLRA